MVDHLKQILNDGFPGEAMRFIVVGAISFLIDLGTLVGLQELCFNRCAGGLFFVTAIAFTVSLSVHYVLTSCWVFRRHGINTVKAHAKAGMFFVVTNVIGLGINEIMLLVGVSWLSFHYLPVKVAACGVVMVWNFLCQKFFIFK